MTDGTIELERLGDERAIGDVHRACFPTGMEAELVDRMRASGSLVISMVAREEMAGSVGSSIVGHVAFSEATPGRGLGLAPVAVVERCRSQGIAAALIRAGLSMASERGYAWVMVLGEPGYYGRFGFRPASGYGLSCVFGGRDAFQVMALPGGMLPERGTRLAYAEEFGVFEG